MRQQACSVGQQAWLSVQKRALRRPFVFFRGLQEPRVRTFLSPGTFGQAKTPANHLRTRDMSDSQDWLPHSHAYTAYGRPVERKFNSQRRIFGYYGVVLRVRSALKQSSTPCPIAGHAVSVCSASTAHLRNDSSTWESSSVRNVRTSVASRGGSRITWASIPVVRSAAPIVCACWRRKTISTGC